MRITLIHITAIENCMHESMHIRDVSELAKVSSNDISRETARDNIVNDQKQNVA